MSGGTPVAGGIMRQRHSQGYASSGDDLEDDACSRHAATFFAPVQKQQTWVEVVENVIWIASAVFIFYYGDGHSNFVYVLWHDDRIRRLLLCLGVVAVLVNCVVFYHSSVLAWSFKAGEKVELLNPSALPLVTLLGVISFCFLVMQVFLRALACMEFLDYPSSVHIVHGSCDNSPLHDDGYIQTTGDGPHRLKLPYIVAAGRELYL